MREVLRRLIWLAAWPISAQIMWMFVVFMPIGLRNKYLGPSGDEILACGGSPGGFIDSLQRRVRHVRRYHGSDRGKAERHLAWACSLLVQCALYSVHIGFLPLLWAAYVAQRLYIHHYCRREE